MSSNMESLLLGSCSVSFDPHKYLLPTCQMLLLGLVPVNTIQQGALLSHYSEQLPPAKSIKELLLQHVSNPFAGARPQLLMQLGSTASSFSGSLELALAQTLNLVLGKDTCNSWICEIILDSSSFFLWKKLKSIAVSWKSSPIL